MSNVYNNFIVYVSLFLKARLNLFWNASVGFGPLLLYYYGIISNTVNLKSKVTTERDINILEWLKSQCNEIDEKLVAKIFEEKSKFDVRDLRRFMEVEEKFVLNTDEMIIGQLEITNALKFLDKYKDNIDGIIKNVYEDYKVKYVFINIIDILNGYHLIYAFDKESILFLEKMFNVKLIKGIYKEDKIVLRKEIKKYLKSL